MSFASNLMISQKSLAVDPKLDLNPHFAEISRDQAEEIVECHAEKSLCEDKLSKCGEPDHSLVVWVGAGMFLLGMLAGGAIGR